LMCVCGKSEPIIRIGKSRELPVNLWNQKDKKLTKAKLDLTLWTWTPVCTAGTWTQC
jgi:hypothetical protein